LRPSTWPAALGAACILTAIPFAAQAATDSPPKPIGSGDAALAAMDTRPAQLVGMDPVVYFEAKQKLDGLVMAARLGVASPADLNAAKPMLERLANAYPYNGDIWSAVGKIRLLDKSYSGAAEAFVAADTCGLGVGADFNAADAARAFALAGNADAALSWLTIALHRYTYRDPSALLADPAFDGLRRRTAFRDLTGESAKVGTASRTARLQADLDYYMTQYASYRFPHLTPEQVHAVQATAARLSKRLSSLSDDQFVMELQRLSASAPGGHNTLTHLNRGIDGATLPGLPLAFYVFPEGVFVVGAKDPRYDRLIGARVTAFGDVSTDEMLRRVAPLVDRDLHADSQVIRYAPNFLIQLAVLHDLGATGNATDATLTLEKDGTVETVKVAGVPDAGWPSLHAPAGATSPPPLALAHVDDYYWFSDMSPDTTYVQFNDVVDRKDESLADFGLRLREHLRQTGAKNLIVDARFNGGGNTFEYLELLRTLVWFDAQAGHRLYYVEGRDMFSAADNFGTQVRGLTHAVFVGEPANSPRNAGDPAFVTLPNTHISVRFSTVTWALYYPDDTRTGIAPDIPVVLSARDYFANKDPVLETIQAVIARQN